MENRIELNSLMLRRNESSKTDIFIERSKCVFLILYV